MKGLSRISVIIFLVCGISACKYKENDFVSILPVKARLERTWKLNELHWSNEDMLTRYPEYKGQELVISNVTKNYLLALVGNYGPVEYQFKNNKTLVYSQNENDQRHFKITKLTAKELWLEGENVLGIGGAPPNGITKAKYSAK